MSHTGHVEISSNAVRAAYDIKVVGMCGPTLTFNAALRWCKTTVFYYFIVPKGQLYFYTSWLLTIGIYVYCVMIFYHQEKMNFNSAGFFKQQFYWISRDFLFFDNCQKNWPLLTTTLASGSLRVQLRSTMCNI